MKLLLDSNIVIYSLQPENEPLKKWLDGSLIFISAITQLEVLGYHRITQEEINFARRYFSNCKIIPITYKIIEIAISLRQEKSMSIGDAIIAATARRHDLPLMSANTKDFKHINQLELINPLEN